MNKNELESHKLTLRAQNFDTAMKLVAKVGMSGCGVWATSLIINGLTTIVVAQPDSINALAMVIEKLNINSILGWIVGGIGAIGYKYERIGKQRAIQKSADLRKQLEMKDAHNTSSQLDENGHTPK